MHLWTQNNVKNHNDLRPKNVYLQSQPQPHGQLRGQLFLRWSLLAEKKTKYLSKSGLIWYTLNLCILDMSKSLQKDIN